MELKWEQVGPLGVGPMPVYSAKSIADDRNKYDISGTEGYWYCTYFDFSSQKLGGPAWNLGWAPTLDMMKERCQILEGHLIN